MDKRTPWHARLALTLGLLLPVYFALAALGTKFGLWTWQFGLLTLTAFGGLLAMAVVALIALVSFGLCLRRTPKKGWGSAFAGLLIPGAIFGYLLISLAGAGSHPIHDVATDTSNPPALSAQVLSDRAASQANALNPYNIPLGQTEQFAEAPAPLADQTYADIIAASYPDLVPLVISEADPNAAVNAIQSAMREMGFSAIRYNKETSTVEGLAETFWFGFKDDVVARIADGKIDFRSVSRVGQSDLGANSKRILDLRARVAEELEL
ncbi:MAG: DUF1499 domain-containing protein [Pseudomonadota bacterium]